MKLILLTQPHFFEGEAQIINDLFAHGLGTLHLRKPQAREEEVQALVGQIDARFRDRIVRHNHDLHSCHTLEEVARNKTLISEGDASGGYVFLSPIFDSISKRGYKAAFSHEELRRAADAGIIDERVVALGGITPATAREAQSLGFGGVAVLGDIWQSSEPVKRLQEYNLT